MKYLNRVLGILSVCAVLAMPLKANARVMVGGYGGYGFGLVDELDLGLSYGGNLELMIAKKVSIGGFVDFQKIDTGSSLLTAKYMIYGGTLNYWVSPNFYLGAHGGILKATVNGARAQGSETVVGGQAGIAMPLAKRLNFGIEGRYVMAASNTSFSFAQAMGKLSFKF